MDKEVARAAVERRRLADGGDDRGVFEDFAADLSEEVTGHANEESDGGDEESVFDHRRGIFFASEAGGGGEKGRHGQVLQVERCRLR